MRRHRTAVIVLSAAIAATAYGIYWTYLAARVREGVEAWIAEERRQGADIQYGQLTVGGFPLSVTVSAMDARYSRPDGLIWEAQSVDVSARPWSWRTVDVELGGGQRIAVADFPGLTAAAESGEGTLRVDADGRIVAVELMLKSIAMAFPDIAGLTTVARLRCSWREAVPENGADPVTLATLAAEGLVLPVAPLPELGAGLRNAMLDLTVTGPLPPRLVAPALSSWRDAGGMVAIDTVDLEWGPLSLHGTGTATLGATLQPEGRLTVDARGFTALIDALRAAGHLDEQSAGFASAGLMLLAKPGDDGRPVLTAPLTLQDRKLSFGPLKLAELPAVAWPES